MKKMEFKEVKLPNSVLDKLEKSAEAGNPITLGQAGMCEWLTELSSTEGWCPVWQAFRFPYVMFEREIEKS